MVLSFLMRTFFFVCVLDFSVSSLWEVKSSTSTFRKEDILIKDTISSPDICRHGQFLHMSPKCGLNQLD